MTEDGQRQDIPKVVATIMTEAPGLVIRLGFTYLRFKKESKRAAKGFVRDLEKEGMPPEMAKKLGEIYASELSIRKLVTSGAPSFLGSIKS